MAVGDGVCGGKDGGGNDVEGSDGGGKGGGGNDVEGGDGGGEGSAAVATMMSCKKP